MSMDAGLFRRLVFIAAVGGFVFAIPSFRVLAEGCTFLNTTARVCIFDQTGIEDCEEQLYTEVICTSGLGSGMGYLPYFPGGGAGGPGPVGRPKGDGPPTIPQQQRLNAGISKAKQELESNEACAGLKETMGISDSRSIIDMINTTTYRNWSSHPKCPSAHAFTFVNSDVVWLCRSFEDISATRAAELVIHEALHSLGLRESPQYSGEKTSAEIDAAVREACSGL